MDYSFAKDNYLGKDSIEQTIEHWNMYCIISSKRDGS